FDIRWITGRFSWRGTLVAPPHPSDSSRTSSFPAVAPIAAPTASATVRTGVARPSIIFFDPMLNPPTLSGERDYLHQEGVSTGELCSIGYVLAAPEQAKTVRPNHPRPLLALQLGRVLAGAQQANLSVQAEITNLSHLGNPNLPSVVPALTHVLDGTRQFIN